MQVMRRGTASFIAAGLLVGSAVTVAAQDEDTGFEAPVEFSGRLLCGPQTAWGEVETVMTPMGEFQMTRKETRGDVWALGFETMSDPRLAGTVTFSLASDEYFIPGVDGQPFVSASTLRIENDGGAWQGSVREFGLADGFATTGRTVALVGEGDYEGLTAIWESSWLDEECGSDVRGIIIDGDLPPFPEPSAGD